jgi:uncharacterized protein
MTLKNLISGKIICKDLKICESFIDRMFGLLVKKNPRNLLFKTRFGIHTFFLKEPIDLLVLNQQLQIVKVKPSLKPNQLFFWNPKHSTVIELINGTIRKFNIKPGQFLKIN